MGRYRRKKTHINNKAQKKKYRTKRRTKDLDQIQEDMLPVNAPKLLKQSRDVDLPGEGQFYCLYCARYFMNSEAMRQHFGSKLHKRRLKALSDPIYTHKEAEMAASMGNYQLPVAPLPKAKPIQKRKAKRSTSSVVHNDLERKLLGMDLDTRATKEGFSNGTEVACSCVLDAVELQFVGLKV